MYKPSSMRWFFIATALLLRSPLQSAPPTLTAIYPSGGQRGTTVTLTVTGSFDKWPIETWIEGKGVTVEADKEKGKLRFSIATDAVPGVRYFRIFDDRGASSLRPFIVGTLPEVEEKEPNDEIANAQMIDPAGAVINGKLLKKGDVDCFAMKLDAGQTVVASLLANRILKSPMDALLQIVSSDGFVLARNNDEADLDPRIVFNAPKAGVYTIRLFAFPATPDGSVRFAGGDNYQYRLTLTTAPFADYPWPLAIARNSKAKVELHGWNLGEKYRRVAVAKTDEAETVLSPIGLANAVSIRRESHDCFDETHKQALNLPFTRSGRVSQAGRADSFLFTAKKGRAIHLELESATLGFPLLPVLQIRDSAGKSLAKVEPVAANKDCELNFTPSADGDYRIEVSDLAGNAGERFIYRLRAVLVEPDFDISVAADRFTVQTGKPLEIPVTIIRRGGLDKPIEFKIEGLSKEIQVEQRETRDAKAPKSAILKLTMKSSFSGPFRITAKAADMDRNRTARATLTDLDHSTADLWLTATESVPVPNPPAKK